LQERSRIWRNAWRTTANGSIELIVSAAVWSFLEMPNIVARIVLAILGVILLAKAIADIKKRKSTHS
jgi:hypothetical protein